MLIRIIKFLSGVFVAVVFLLGTSVIVLPYFVSTDTIRVRVAQDLSAWTGYNVQLREPPRLKLFPYPKAFLSGVTLTSKINDVAPLMEAESIEVDLSLIDLLRGCVSFSETRIVRPQFVMEKPFKTVSDFFNTLSRSQGTLGLAVRNAREIVKLNPDQPDIESLLNQPFGRIVIENGVLIYRDSVSDVTEKITGLNATIDWSESTQAARFRASARWHGELTELLINADQALLLLAGGQSSLRVSFNSLRGGITFTGKARLSEYYIFDGKVSMRSPGWNQTLAWIGGNQLWGGRLKVPIVWESHFLAQPKRIEMNNITFNMGAANARGALEFDFQNHVPNIIGSLAFDTMNLNILESMFLPVGEENEFLDMVIFDRIGLDVRISAPQAKIGKIALTNLAAAMQIKNGYGNFDLGNAHVFGGSIQSNVQIVPNGKKARIEGRVSGTSVDVQTFSEALGLTQFIHAKTDFIVTIQILISSWSEISEKMQGQLTMNMLSGRLLKYDLNELQNKLSENEQFYLVNNHTFSTPFERLNIKAKFSDGIVTQIESLMRTADWNLSIDGPIAVPITKKNQKDFMLQGRLQKNNRSDTLCKDVQCLTNSLMRPFSFSLGSTEQSLEKFFVRKNIDEN
ncbi:AsmA family protein [Bartonella sp. WD12.1]|uniref:AsmA family protein n=1 Tax=Bartonella sp. WD12.1 TaxID=1933903 RepID=UPI00099AFF6E|nr:AsmA family protein [Bartonella sp. WD12.1]OPB29104.1 AsmA protein [Bartonella sp. WD12.1]